MGPRNRITRVTPPPAAPAQVFLDLKYVGGMDEVQEMLDCGTFKQMFEGYIAG